MIAVAEQQRHYRHVAGHARQNVPDQWCVQIEKRDLHPDPGHRDRDRVAHPSSSVREADVSTAVRDEDNGAAPVTHRRRHQTAAACDRCSGASASPIRPAPSVLPPCGSMIRKLPDSRFTW